MSKFASGTVMSKSKDFLCGLSWNSGFSQTLCVSLALYPGARGLGTRLVCPLVHTMLSMYMYILLELCNGRVLVGVV